jgi:3-deoxy-D-manno-octulosonic-acid transferase
VPLGGHNVLEPAALHCAVLAGPHTNSAPRAYEAVLQAQGFGRIANSTDIAREAERLLGDPAAARAAGEAAARGAAALAGAVGRTETALRTMLDARA